MPRDLLNDQKIARQARSYKKKGLLTPNTHQPWLLVAGQAGGAVVVFQLGKTRCCEQRTPVFEVVVCAVALAIPAFAVVRAGWS